MDTDLEEGSMLNLDFRKINSVAKTGHEVIPAVVQDLDSGAVLIIGYVNREALDKARELNKVVFWSTSRNELWIKGDSSGDTLSLKDIRVNCEQNSILYLVQIDGAGACHTKNANKSRLTCFYRSLQEDGTLVKDARYPPSLWQGDS